MSELVVSTLPRLKQQRLEFVGDVQPSEKSLKHFTEVVLPLADSVLARFNISQCSYRITINNLGAASISNQNIQITGHSMDVSLFLTLLATPLGLAIPADYLFTGHIGGAKGQILLVQSLPEKIQCAIEAKHITKFFIPSLESDDSLRALRPKLREELHCTIAKAKREIKISPANDVTELVRNVFDEHTVLLGALQTGRYKDALAINDTFTKHMGHNLEDRFIHHLKNLWMHLDDERAHVLCREWVHYHLAQNHYPADAGGQLTQLLRCLPPQVKKHLRQNLSIPKENRLKLAKLACKTDADDVQLLFSLERALRPNNKNTNKQKPDTQITSIILDDLLEKVSPHYLAKEISAPLFEARALYFLPKNTVADSTEFFEIITSFYVHVLQHIGNIKSQAVDSLYRADAIALLERAYNQHKGSKGALRESLNPLHGGLAHILNAMIQTLCEERQNHHVQDTLATVIDPLDWLEELALMKALLARIQPDLPTDLQSLTAEELACNWRHLVVQYAKTQNQFHELIRNT